MKRTFRLLMLLSLAMWLLPGTAAAVDFCEDVSKYTFDYFAPATIRFTMPVYEKDGIDSWVYDGNVYAQAEGEAKMKVFHWETVSKDIDGDATTMTVLMSRNINDDGTFVYKRRDGNNYPVGYNSSSFEVQIIPSTDNFEVVVEWTVPYSLRGKRVEMSFESKVDFNSSIYAKTTLSGIPKKTFSISAAPELTEPQVMEPVLAYEKGRAGQVMVPWVISTNKVTEATAHWYNELTGKDESQTLDAKSSGFVYLDAFTPLSKFYVEAKYMNSENREVGPVKSTPELTIPMLHRPRNATTDVNAQGNIVVSWRVESKEHADITKSDYFEVQRNTSGNSDADDPGWRSVGIVDFVDGQETYSFTDDIFLQNYQNRAVCYRIRRASVATWGWKGEVGAAETSTTKMFMLPSVNTATITKAADWGKDNLHNATLQFTLGTPRLDFVSKDLDGRVVCQLRTAADWDSLAVQVSKGETVLAMMMADIDLGDRQTMLGTPDTPFRGVFNGLGHTLTVHYNANSQNTAPISAAWEAIISNVHVKGEITSSAKFNGGLVGYVTEGSDVVMENCWVSATVASSINGDATMGGVVGHTADGAKLRITNTLFDGTLEGANSTGIGGIIGWVERNGKVTLDRVTFAPTAVTTQNDGSTFARCRDEVNTLTITHCKTTYILGNLNSGDITIPDIKLRTAADWEQLCKVVAEGRNVDVYMLSDINLGNSTLMLGDESHPFTGAFHGQGHTLTVAYSANALFTAPFSVVGDADISNLRVAGSITSTQKHSAGLVGLVAEGKKTTIKNCIVSASITGNLSGDATNGGIVSWNRGNLTIEDSRFEGSMLGSHCNKNAGILAWTDRGTATLHRITFVPQQIDTAPDDCKTFYRTGGAAVTLTDAYCTHVWNDAQEGTFLIGSADDWNAFAVHVNNLGGHPLNAILTADISVSTAVGSEQSPYSGTFDGNGHRLTITLTQRDVFNAPFRCAKDYTIQNLIVYGNIEGKNHSAGLVGSSYATYGRIRQNTIENCWVRTSISCFDDHSGGFIGHGHEANHTITNCLFQGSLWHNQEKGYGAAFIGWEEGDRANVITNCYALGGFNMQHSGMNCSYRQGNAFFYGNLGDCRNNYANHAYGDWVGTILYAAPTWDGANALQRQLGSEWQVIGDYPHVRPVMRQIDGVGDAPQMDTTDHSSTAITPPTMNTTMDLDLTANTIWDERAKLVLTIKKYAGHVLKYTERRTLTDEERLAGRADITLTTACVEYDFDLGIEQGTSVLYGAGKLPVTKTETGDKATYEFHSRGTITSANAETGQASVQLTWDTDEGDLDYFCILRRDKMASADTAADTLATHYQQHTFIDKAVRPQHIYTYTIVGVTQCEGQHTVSLQVDGQCASTGVVKGYVRLADGTALANREVTAEPVGDIPDAEPQTCVTDSTGFFLIDGLIYQVEGSYRLTVATVGDETPFAPQTITFDTTVGGNQKTNILFHQATFYVLSGKVLYEGSSIPVMGVTFLRDSVVVMNGKGKPLTTDAQGRFSISIPQGTHTIQAVKQGHVFQNEGFYLDPDAQGDDKRQHNWQKNVNDIYLWDETKVTLRGRVVGGNDQGLLPLGKSLSRNNLGDTLTVTLQLEGDNTSYLVRDQLDPLVKERNLTVTHGVSDTTLVRMTQHRILLHPDGKTGEYQLPLYPVKYKVTEVYATGYATLFPSGMVSESVDLSHYQQGDTATYSRIFHNPATLHYEQVNPRPDEHYFGLKSYTALDVAGAKRQVQLWDKAKGYALRRPVFMAGNAVVLTLEAREEYLYNNDVAAVPDVVPLQGGKVFMQNGFINTTDTAIVALDSIGTASYVFTPQNTTVNQENDAALRTLTLTLLYDSTYYDVPSLRGYVMASKAIPNGRRVVADGGTYLVDILRDPPGGGSSAYIEEGSKLSCTFNCDVTTQAGVNLELSAGKGSNIYNGIVAVATEAGTISNVSNVMTTSLPIVFSYYNAWQYNYNFETTERIQTSTSAKGVGADADVYIGMTQDAVVEDAVAVRVVPSELYQRLLPRTGGTMTIDGHPYQVKNGLVKVLARGVDAQGDSVYLIRDEVLQISTRLRSTFAHTQTYIQKEIIPTLFNIRSQLMLPMNTTQEYAQQVADHEKHPVYISLLPESDDNYTGLDNDGKPTYLQVNPQNSIWTWGDSIQSINQQLRTWVGFIAQNEQEKLTATNLVKRYDFDGRTNIQYSETFNVGLSESRYMNFPFSSIKVTGSTGIGQSNKGKYNREMDEDDNVTEVSIDAVGVKFSLKFKPVVGANFNHKFGKSESYSKKTGFTLAMDPNSNLLVDVYRTEVNMAQLKEAVEKGAIDVFTVASQDYIDAVRNGKYEVASSLSYLDYDTPQYRNFVFRTRAGATTSPWEGQRVTQYYSPGTELDARTQDIDRPHIWAEQASVSNVPYDEPARFTIYLENDTEVPGRAAPNKFTLVLEDYMNPKGAKVQIDGNPLPGEGHWMYIPAGTVVEKQVEVYASKSFDYEDIGLALLNKDDPSRVFVQKLSAHFVPVAGKVNISLPGNKWVLNTQSSYDTDQQDYYLPVRIEGFDVNYRGFDHIELQYKLTTQGDKDWVNVCSYYKNDSLMALASGSKALIRNDGYIEHHFFGERSPIEQQYDLRAVCFCRHGGGYLTRSSEVLTGVKDTRRPKPFGTPSPANGILDIGDDIVIAFSEQIAGNYLSEVNNFEVLGTVNSSNIALGTTLRFNGDGMASSKAVRNLVGKDFTIDLMLLPDNNGRAMNFFTHGGNEEGLTLGLTADRRLRVEIGDTVVTSTKAIPFDGMRQVAVVMDADVGGQHTDITFYDGSTAIGKARYNDLYRGTGALFFGCGAIDRQDGDFEGNMLEARLWNAALTPSQLANYAQKQLTGYELGLTDNYPMNEGVGEYCYDRGVGANDLLLFGATWYVPDGIAMRLDGEKGFGIDPQHFQREDYQDYTMTFWFRSDDQQGTLFANGMATDEPNYREHFRFHIDEGRLKLNLGGKEVGTDAFVADGQWHNTALTVNRSRNVGNLYVDAELRQTFTVDTLGGIGGNRLAAGAVYTDATTATDAIRGHIDEIAMYEMVVPENMLTTYGNTLPSGEEMGMMAYLSFGRNELQGDNSQRLMPTGISLKRYRDANTGKLIEARRDTLVAQEVVERLADRTVFAPMRNAVKLENIPYSYVAEGKNLYINFDVPDKSIEKTNVYLTVKDVADLQGNLMASPVCMNLYAYRSPLRWDVKRLTLDLRYGEETEFEVTVCNKSGKRQPFKLEGLPLWITASQTMGTLNALDEVTITMTVSPYINIGDYDEVIYLTGVDEMAEPLPLTIHVRGEEPQWVVDDELKQKGLAMHVLARVEIDGQVAHDTDDVLAAFGNGHRVLGVTHIDAEAGTDNALAYLTIYHPDNSATPLRFEFFDASTGKIHVLAPADGSSIVFEQNAVLGKPTDPVVLTPTGEKVQTLHLKRGWNWISFYVQPDTATVATLLNNATAWEVRDGLEVQKSDGTYTVLGCKAIENKNDFLHPLKVWDSGDSVIVLNPERMYRFYSTNDKTGYLAGRAAMPIITLHQGWNRIAYISETNLPVATAMSDYLDEGNEGDIIKSQDEFAMMTIDSQGNKMWTGTLKYMSSGQGYMLYRKKAEEVSILYPTYSSGSRYNGTSHRAPWHNASGTSMTMVAVAEGVETLPGDTLTVWCGAERCGVAVADDEGLFWVSVGDTEGVTKALTFTLERDGEVVAVTTRSHLSYQANATLGTPDTPTAISFVDFHPMPNDDNWYTLSGIQLQKKPERPGVYIHDNQVKMVK